MVLIRHFCQDESGATAIEYSLVASGIALAILSAVQALGTVVAAKYTGISTNLK